MKTNKHTSQEKPLKKTQNYLKETIVLLVAVIIILLLLLDGHQKELDNLRAENSLLRMELKVVNDLVDSIKNNVNVLKLRLNVISSNLDSVKDKICSLESQKSGMEKKINLLLAENSNLKAQINLLSDSLNSKAMQIISLVDTCFKNKSQRIAKKCLSRLCSDSFGARLSVNVCRIHADKKEFLLRSISPLFKSGADNYKLSYKYNFLEYVPNKYSSKEENAFNWALICGITSAGLYAGSEALGHPEFWDGKDNSHARNKSDLIRGLRVGSAVFGTLSLIEFGRTIYFHNKCKLYLSPTSIKLNISLDKKIFPNEK